MYVFLKLTAPRKLLASNNLYCINYNELKNADLSEFKLG